MEQTDNEVRHFRHEEEIALLKEQVGQLKRKSTAGWIWPLLVIIVVVVLWQRQSAERDYRTAGEEPYSLLTDDGLRSNFDQDTGLELTTFPRPGLTLRQGNNSYRITVVQGKLVAESTDGNGKAIVKVLLDNGDADR